MAEGEVMTDRVPKKQELSIDDQVDRMERVVIVSAKFYAELMEMLHPLERLSTEPPPHAWTADTLAAVKYPESQCRLTMVVPTPEGMRKLWFAVGRV